MVKDIVSLGLGMCPDSLRAEVIKFKLEQGLQHVEGVTKHRLTFSTGARPSVIARCSVAAADEMVDDGTPTQMQQETHHIRLAVAGKKGRERDRETEGERERMPEQVNVWTLDHPRKLPRLSSKARIELLGQRRRFCR